MSAGRSGPLLALVLSACGSPEPAPDAAASSGAPAARPSAAATGGPVASASATARPDGLPTASATGSAAAASRSRRGLWIWEFEKNAPPPERAAALAAEIGAARVFIKGNNGRDGERWFRNARPENLRPFTERGIEVWLFGYFYPPDVADADGKAWGTLDEQVAAAMRVAAAPEVHGFVVDAEVEWRGRPEDARALCRALRAKLGGRPLAYTSFGWLKPNKAFPFQAFDRACSDAFLPQVYSSFGWPGGVTASLERLWADRAALGLSAPVWPVQSNERDPATDQLSLFLERAGPDASIFYLHPEGSPQNEKLRALTFR